jgi:hypothetical protein
VADLACSRVLTAAVRAECKRRNGHSTRHSTPRQERKRLGKQTAQSNEADGTDKQPQPRALCA